MTTEMLISALYVFALAAFLGYQVISRVPPLLHTPLDVSDKRNFRHFVSWFNSHWAQLQHSQHDSWLHRSCLLDHKRSWWFCHYRQETADV